METLESPRLLGESWEVFSDGLDMLRDRTARNYLRSFIAFLDYVDLTSEELCEQHKARLKSDSALEKKKTSKMVYSYQKFLVEEKGLKIGSTKSVVNGVTKFFSANELYFQMNGYKVKIEDESQVIREIAGISKNELQKILNVCGSIRMLTMIHIAKESGLRLGDICNIKKETLKPILEKPDLQWFTWTMLPEKNRGKSYPMFADPCLGPESIRWIHTWIEEMEKKGVVSKFLFCNMKDTPRIVTKGGKVKEASHKGDKLNAKNISSAYSKLVRKAGLGGKNISFHSLRKYMQTQCESAGVPTPWIYRMQGRSKGSGQRYSKPNERELLERFNEGYSNLRTDVYTHNLMSAQQRRIRELEQERDELLKVQRNFNAIQEEMRLLKAYVRDSPNRTDFETYKRFEELAATDLPYCDLESAIEKEAYPDGLKNAPRTERPEEYWKLLIEGPCRECEKAKTCPTYALGIKALY